MTNPAVHRLKTWPEPFNEVWTGRKPFEVRKNDREFHVHDWLHLEEWDPDDEDYSGRRVKVQVTSIVRGPDWGIPAGFCVMGWSHRCCETECR